MTDDIAAAARLHRLMQAETLLREAGFVEETDGSWHLPADTDAEHDGHPAQEN